MTAAYVRREAPLVCDFAAIIASSEARASSVRARAVSSSDGASEPLAARCWITVEVDLRFVARRTSSRNVCARARDGGKRGGEVRLRDLDRFAGAIDVRLGLRHRGLVGTCLEMREELSLSDTVALAHVDRVDFAGNLRRYGGDGLVDEAQVGQGLVRPASGSHRAHGEDEQGHGGALEHARWYCTSGAIGRPGSSRSLAVLHRRVERRAFPCNPCAATKTLRSFVRPAGARFLHVLRPPAELRLRVALAAALALSACGARTALDPLEAAVDAAADASRSVDLDGARPPGDDAQIRVDGSVRDRACGACLEATEQIPCAFGALCTWGQNRTLPNCVSKGDLPPSKIAPCGAIFCDATLYECIDPDHGICATADSPGGALPACSP